MAAANARRLAMEQQLSPNSRSWLEKVSFHVWAFWEARKAAMVLALSTKTISGQQRDEHLRDLVRRLI